ncbi:carbohydrate ABC transporter permease [Sediminispirochaeta bajacaliforniensis]|uniref:carbohydrate ABC transporter permease n=1 Tax=Sediminispirochaeta bajacaliforniensis TaxID=148 RepID=UPI0003653C78|nr:carbohydrate ABC transporter permease [Sediminispirochaeta bajacaliforniensis]
MNKKSNQNYILECIAALLFLAFIFPFFIVLINSAKGSFEVTQQPMKLPDDWSMILKNMVSIWTNPNIQYQNSFISSSLITAISLVVIVMFSSQAAWVLVRTKTRISRFFFFIFVAAMVIPFQIVMFPLLSWFRMIYTVTGIRLLRTYQGMILAYLGFGLSLSIFMYHGFIKSIPLELEEAATIDGCSKARIFFTIISPILKPIHATVVVLNGIWIWNDYLLPLLILGKGNRVQTIPLAVANFAGAYVKQWDLILTAILMAMIPIIIFFLLAQKHIIRGMVAGSIK